VIEHVIDKTLPFFLAFVGPFVLTLLLTPLVRELHRKWGMVDKPDPRRINKVPIPRGGGIAIVISVFVGYGLFVLVFGRPAVQGVTNVVYWRMSVLALAISLLGLADDRFSFPPRLKLLGQLVIAFLVWKWADLGFNDLWPSIPMWLDCLLTVFWITGAVNAFNLIDGLDGLASGIALIATIGMGGSCFLANNPQAALFYFAFGGALLGFLRYNYNPASIFLGDSGSMYIGFVLSCLPLASHTPNSFLVSVGVPLLAMGVPIFDTALAILRRSIRHLLARGSGAGRVMTADSDHLHHRILRASGLNQRKAAWILYSIAAMLVTIGLVAIVLKSHAAGFWLGAVAIAAVVLFKDATIELFDAGRLLSSVAHSRDRTTRRRFAVLAVPFYVFFDVFVLIGVYFLCTVVLDLPQTEHTLRSFLPMRVVSVFVFLVLFRTYRTIWSRAVGSNFMRLALACVFGSVAGSVFVYYWPSTVPQRLAAVTLFYAVVSFLCLLGIRVVRDVIRDFFYALDCARLKGRKDVSRILVYGAGLRYKAFRRELVRTTSANDRMIVGILDDDVFLKGRYIGGIRIFGTINDAPEVINAVNADAVVIACEISDEWMKVVREILDPTGVKVSRFILSEQPV